MKLLLETARRVQAQGPDARAEALLDLLYRTQEEENDPDLKFLIFTEFVPTQQMLREFLEEHGFSVVFLNGTMDLETRQRAQRQFASDARILVSTDAGGEGLNLQFAHVVINYDLPWNPMRIEQRIGRVDRIGQPKPVKAFNMLFAEGAELRVHEVLSEKLQTIYDEFGVDKTGDVLDSAESGAAFEKVYANAILNPEGIEGEVNRLMENVREQAEAEREGKSLYAESSLDAELARRYITHPLPHWIERMTVSYLRSAGGKAEKDLFAYRLTWPDGEQMADVCFHGREAQQQGLNYVSLENPKMRALVERLPRAVAGEPIPRIQLAGLTAKVSGYWSLWQVALKTAGRQNARILPLFYSDEARVFLPTARSIWDKFMQETTAIEQNGTVDQSESERVFELLRTEAEHHGEPLFQELFGAHQQRLRQEREKGRYAYQVRRQALERIGLPEVREFRLKRLADEERAWETNLRREEQVFPELHPIIVLRMEA